MKKLIIVTLIISIVITATIALQAINNSEIIITNYDGYYNLQWKKSIQKSTDIEQLKTEILKLNDINRSRRSTHNALMIIQFLVTAVLFIILFLVLICFIIYSKKIKQQSL